MQWTEERATIGRPYIGAGMAGRTTDGRPISLLIAQDGSHIALQAHNAKNRYLLESVDLVGDLRRFLQGEPTWDN